MATVLGDYLARVRDAALDGRDLAVALAENWEREPWRGYGHRLSMIFRGVLAGRGRYGAEPAVSGTDPAVGDAGSESSDPACAGPGGAAARITPVSLVDADLARVVENARAAARSTHVGGLVQDAAAVHALAVALALRSRMDAPLAQHAFLEAIVVQIDRMPRRAIGGPRGDAEPVPDDVDRMLQDVRHLARRVTPREVEHRLGTNGGPIAAVGAALLAFLRCPESYAAAVEFALRMGGDTATIAAMTGAIAGARHGESGIPVAWLARLENAPRLRGLADDLALVRAARHDEGGAACR